MSEPYEVTVHTNIGRVFNVHATSPEKAEEAAMERYVNLGEEGDQIVYEMIQNVETRAL